MVRNARSSQSQAIAKNPNPLLGGKSKAYTSDIEQLIRGSPKIVEFGLTRHGKWVTYHLLAATTGKARCVEKHLVTLEEWFCNQGHCVLAWIS